MTENAPVDKIKVGISSCLLGVRVRYDGGHRHDAYLTDTLGRWFEYVPVCPEVECGLPVPREAMHLVGDPASPRLVTLRSGVDHTARMRAWAAARVEALRGAGLCGFVFKAKSPSSGLFRVKCHGTDGQPAGLSRGLWAEAFTSAFPHVPAEEEGRLHDPDLREAFIERVFTLWRYRREVAAAPSLPALMTFHARNKLLLMAHAPAAVHELGRMIAGLGPASLPQAVATYEGGLMQALATPADVPRHVNVLQHMQGYLRGAADDLERSELAAVIDAYRRELVPLIVPVTMLRHFVRKYAVAYLADQYYLDPHPAELKLRNHA